MQICGLLAIVPSQKQGRELKIAGEEAETGQTGCRRLFLMRGPLLELHTLRSARTPIHFPKFLFFIFLATVRCVVYV